MQATVIKNEEGIVTVRVRRSGKVDRLHKRHYNLEPGMDLEVRRQVNVPYLVRADWQYSR